MHEELWMEVHYIVQEAIIKTIPKKKKCEQAKWLSKQALQIALKRREVKDKGEKKRYTQLNAEFQRIERRDKKAFLSDVFKEIEKNNRAERLEISTRKLEIPREIFMQRCAQLRTEMVWTSQKQKVLTTGGKNTQKNYTKKVFMTQITTMT